MSEKNETLEAPNEDRIARVDLPLPDTAKGYAEVDAILADFLRLDKRLWRRAMRWLAAHDLFFLTTRVLSTRGLINKRSGLPIFERDWTLRLCRQLESDEHNRPLVAGRGMGKSTLRTKGRNIQRAIVHPNSAGAIFSYQKAAAQKHLSGIRSELEQNELLRTLYPEVFYWSPRKDSPYWTKEELCVKRSTGRPEKTFEAHAFMHGLPTGSHFDRLDWDDVEDDKSVSTPELIETLQHTFRQSGNLKTPGVVRCPTGTYYHSVGLMATLCRDNDRALVYPGEDVSIPGDGPLGGSSEYFTDEELWEWWEELQGERDPTVYIMQVACDYKGASGRRFKRDHVRHYEKSPLDIGRNCYTYVCIDPSRGVHDPSVIWVWGTTVDRKYVWLDCVRKKVDPASRLEETYNMVSKWSNISLGVQEIRIEQFGQADYVSPTKDYLERRGVFTPIIACHDNTKSKMERIWERWQPPLSEGRILMPRTMMIADENGKPLDAAEYFVNFELLEYPKPPSDDMLDAGSLIWEPESKVTPASFPSSGRRDDEDDYDEYAEGTFLSYGVL